MTRLDLRTLSRSELTELICSWGQPKYRADQIYNWLYRNLALSIEEMTNLPAQLRRMLTKETTCTVSVCAKRQCSPDQSAVKLLFTG